VNFNEEVRARHARGQGFPDIVALRSGRLETAPDGVAFPESREEVRRLLTYAAEVHARVVPYGGGTSVVGHVTPEVSGPPILTIDLQRLSGLRALDEVSGLATFGAGTTGPEVEAAVRPRGWTLGHYPQSFEYSTVGGWVATRSSGQQSLRYGRIEDLLAGAHMETPRGPLDLPPFPASAAGPDLRHLLLGSEGRLGVITEVTVRVRPVPKREDFAAVYFRSWAAALEAARTLVRGDAPLAMIRLNGPAETAMSGVLATPSWRVTALRSYLAARGIGEESCLLLVGMAGSRRTLRRGKSAVAAVTGTLGGVAAGSGPGRAWARSRFRMPYLRDSVWEHGYGVDTIETAAPWARVSGLVEAIEGALRGGLAAAGERVLAYTHLSHVYPHGSSVYTTFVFRLARDPADTLARWEVLKDAASRAVQAGGGTISHQHGVGRDHRAYLPAEKGSLGMDLLRGALSAADPDQRMNPGALT
jgi:alkyldihydroxyacetonephosphate synthase